MDFYKIVGYYDFCGMKKMSRKFSSQEECEQWARDNASVSIKVGREMRQVPFTEYVITKVTETKVKRFANGQVC